MIYIVCDVRVQPLFVHYRSLEKYLRVSKHKASTKGQLPHTYNEMELLTVPSSLSPPIQFKILSGDLK